MSSLILLSHFLDVGLQFELFLISELLLLHSYDSSLLDLVDDDLGTLLPGISLSHLSFLLFLKDLEPLDFHHKIKLLLLLNPLRLESLILIKLLITNGNDFRVEDHLIHLLNIVKFIVHHFLSLRKKRLILRMLILLLICWLHFLGSCLVHLDHLLLLGLGLGEGGGFLLIGQLLFLEQLVFSFDCGSVLDSIEVVL